MLSALKNDAETPQGRVEIGDGAGACRYGRDAKIVIKASV
jgi:hypothetical protein